MQRQQQQQFADYDLLAVFSDESKADAAEAKLRKEGFGEGEVHRLAASAVARGQFREHGPSADRSAFFLQTQRARPNPALIGVLALLFAVILGAVGFVGGFAFHVPTPGWLLVVIGVVLGLIIGAIVGATRRGRVRGAIGQDLSRASPAPQEASKDARTVIALSLPDAENISRKSRARAILLNNGGRIDRSVGRRE